jgi:hypothetical protein
VVIAAIGIASVLTGGALAVILAGAFRGALSGALIGGVMGGAMSALSGGSVLDGIADGALSGAVTGAIMGAAAAGGNLASNAIRCGTKLAQVVKNTSVVTRGLSGAMDGFDMLSMG